MNHSYFSFIKKLKISIYVLFNQTIETINLIIIILKNSV